MCAKTLHRYLLSWHFKHPEYERGRTSLGDDEHSERPKILTADNDIDQIRQIAIKNWRIKIRETEKAMNIFRENIYPTLNQDLGTRELSVRLLTSG